MDMYLKSNPMQYVFNPRSEWSYVLGLFGFDFDLVLDGFKIQNDRFHVAKKYD